MDGPKGARGENGPAGPKGEKGDPGLTEEEVKELVRSELRCSGDCGGESGMVLLEKEATPEEATNPREWEQSQGIRREFPASCLQPMDEGSCQDYSLLWYFHPEAKACRPFLFGGCRGNGNRFQSRRECERRCGASAGRGS
ncbi:kunitz-type serine protease inhibitor bitisilin-1-like isoform X1 [Pipra filicauda]|uniref:Kunitz-type serine protease inhibitor bitisilin-1-like isoform X1 n=1 Tax=Pipra filicauda TaxID=649802 RepID=A0A6J2I563_9PASS|nr:kunitz-type serine protease inhibitor bitisilin-1-like isoform X1 [Pipra filicauda]